MPKSTFCLCISPILVRNIILNRKAKLSFRIRYSSLKATSAFVETLMENIMNYQHMTVIVLVQIIKIKLVVVRFLIEYSELQA